MKKVKEFYSAIDAIADKGKFLASVKEGFSEIEDPRAKDNQNYPLVDLLVIILCAILAGANTIADIHMYAQVKAGLFARAFLLKFFYGATSNILANNLSVQESSQAACLFLFAVSRAPPRSIVPAENMFFCRF